MLIILYSAVCWACALTEPVDTLIGVDSTAAGRGFSRLRNLLRFRLDIQKVYQRDSVDASRTECYNSSTMSANILIYISIIASGIALILAIYSIISSRGSRSLRKYFRTAGNQPENLEEMMEQIIERLTHLGSHADHTTETVNALGNQLNTATQHVGILRYNSNGDDGGNLSFSAAFLDASQSGIVLTSLHGRQNSRIYAKVITGGSSESTLSDEEREALIIAITANKN